MDFSTLSGGSGNSDQLMAMSENHLRYFQMTGKYHGNPKRSLIQELFSLRCVLWHQNLGPREMPNMPLCLCVEERRDCLLISISDRLFAPNKNLLKNRKYL